MNKSEDTPSAPPRLKKRAKANIERQATLSIETQRSVQSSQALSEEYNNRSSSGEFGVFFVLILSGPIYKAIFLNLKLSVTPC